VGEPVETQQKLIPGGLRPPRLLDRLSKPFESIWKQAPASAAPHGGDAGISTTAHAAPDFVSHRPTLRLAPQDAGTGRPAPPSWAAHSIAR
jgi:hypothetical protein